MLKNEHLKEWARIVSYHLPHLSLPEVTGLATWSFGMVMTGSSSITRISQFISRLNQEKSNTVRQRLKEWYQDANSKKGEKRSELDVTECFAPLLKWILSMWHSEEKWLPLGIDTTNIGQNFTVLSLHVLYQNCAIPVAWKIVKGTEKGSWKPHWYKLFQSLKDAIPPDWQVIVLADRGLYADWLFSDICALNWHPFLRINHQGTFQIRGEKEWQFLDKVVPQTGMSWSGVVTCFKTHPLNCTLLARWDEGYQDPWLIVTDLAPELGDVLWYSLRIGIECGYRDVLSDGWQWHKTRLTQPNRAERLWLAIAVATLWTLSVGSDINQQPLSSFIEQLPPRHQSNKPSVVRETGRQISCFLQGLLTIIADLLNGKGICLNGLFPFPPPFSESIAFNSS
jgi:Transposase DDE domain